MAGMADRMVEWQTEMATYVLFTVHTDTNDNDNDDDDDDDDTLIFYSIDDSFTLADFVGWVASQEAADWAALLDRRSDSKSAAAPKAAALAALASTAVVAVAVWERQRRVAP